MSQTLGEMVSTARKRKKLTQEELGELVDLSKSAISKIENNDFEVAPNPRTIIRVADALECDQILYKYLEDNPVYNAVLPKVFPDLNNIRRDPAIIFTRLTKELEEAKSASIVLSEVFSNADPGRFPDYDEVFKSNMEQIIDAKRCIEILELRLVAVQLLTKAGLKEIYDSQQSKCEANGHHISKKTGTEG